MREMLLAGETQIKIANELIEYIKASPPALSGSGGEYLASGESSSAGDGLPGEIRDFSPPDCFIVEFDPRDYSNSVLRVVKHLVGDVGLPCIYVSVTKPVRVMEDIFRKAGVDTNKIRFIECSSILEGGSIHPTNLTELNIVLETFVREMSGKRFVLFDTLSALGVYNSKQSLADFVSVVSKSSKLEGYGLLWLHVKSSTEVLDSVLQTFVDKVVGYTKPDMSES